MATFKVVVRSRRTDGTYLVYIRCTHNRQVEYIKTDYYVVERLVGKNGKIKDSMVMGICGYRISEFHKKLNLASNTRKWSVKEVVKYLNNENEKIPFILYCQQFIDRMINEGREKSASNYKCAKKSFEAYFGRNITFQNITSHKLKKWIETLRNTARAKETYPKAIKTIFDAGCLEYNDYDRNNIRISSRPFMGVKIPKHDRPEKRAIEKEYIQAILGYDAKTKQTEKTRDIAKLIFYLVGMNTVDLFNLEHANYRNGKICYNRSKTKHSRDDKAYIEIAVHPEIKGLLKKYKGENKLFDFGYSNDRSFNKHVNIGLKTICKDLGIPPVDTYTFRHSWATIAQNDCGASDEQVAFCLNHGSAYKVTTGYIKKSFAPIDELNSKVIDYVFNNNNDDNMVLTQKKSGRKRKVKLYA